MLQEKKFDWNYDESSGRGPSKWSKHFVTGNRQSPINIITSDLYQSISKLTCCNGQLIESNYDQTQNELTLLNEQLSSFKMGQANNNNSNNNKIKFGSNRRAHLDSIGEDERDDPDSGRMSTPENGNDNYNNLFEQQNLTNEQNGKTNLESGSKQKTRYFTSRRKLFLGYPRYLDKMKIENTGHNWQVNIPPELSLHTLICGPPFGDREYRLAQFHCHWGPDSEHGSEHHINGRSYSAEIHFVHWNCSEFKSMEEASKHPHGLAVLAVLVQSIDGEQNRNKYLDRIVEPLKRLRRARTSLETCARLDIKRLFPSNRWNYATYEGSLTTPPLSEVVDWLVFLDPIQCSSSQVDQFRQLECSTRLTNGPISNSKLVDNCRPIQATNERLVTIWSHH